MTTIATGARSDRRGSRKIAALLAGGLVLGVGTMTTLASWNDSGLGASTPTITWTVPAVSH